MAQTNDVRFLPVSAEDSETVRKLSDFAGKIVREHFDPIIGPEQNSYMIARFQSAEAIHGQIATGGYRYYIVESGEDWAGFIAFYPRGERMYLSKFYLNQAFRGRGIAGKMFGFIREQTVKEGLSAIFLNVSRFNSDVISVYHHFGFHCVRMEQNDIGNGFIMDDYVMEKWVAPRTLLYVDTCLRTGSRTRELADAFLNAYRKAHPQDTVDVVRLAEADIHCIRGEELERREALKSEGKIDAPEFAEARRFAAADGIVVAAPMWELSFPAILKAYIETVSVPGITFRYGEGDTGCIGCCKASRLLYLTTRGGLYTGAASGLELGEKEMKALSQFFGIPGFDCLFAEGTDLLPPEEVAERMEQAKSAAAQMARVW